MGNTQAVDLIPAEQVWACERCPTRVRTRGHGVRTPLHPCSGASGFRLPMIAEGERGDVRTVEREDYVTGEDVQRDGDGRPIMRAEVEHADGHTDVWAYAPTAKVKVQS